MTVEEKLAKVRAALSALVDASSNEELTQMKQTLDALPIPNAERVRLLNAIDALLETEDL